MLDTTEESLYHFLLEHSNNRAKRELLLFWGMHPHAKFGLRAICYALDCSKLDAERALKIMVEDGLLDKLISNGAALYSLTTNEEKRQPILEMAGLGWDQRQLILRCVEQRGRVAKC